MIVAVRFDVDDEVVLVRCGCAIYLALIWDMVGGFCDANCVGLEEVGDECFCATRGRFHSSGFSGSFFQLLGL